MFDVEDELRKVRLALGSARSHAPELPIRQTDPVKAIPDLLTALEQLNAAVDKIAKYLTDGRGGGRHPYGG
jgi:hypothetical protein